MEAVPTQPGAGTRANSNPRSNMHRPMSSGKTSDVVRQLSERDGKKGVFTN